MLCICSSRTWRSCYGAREQNSRPSVHRPQLFTREETRERLCISLWAAAAQEYIHTHKNPSGCTSMSCAQYYIPQRKHTHTSDQMLGETHAQRAPGTVTFLGWPWRVWRGRASVKGLHLKRPLEEGKDLDLGEEEIKSDAGGGRRGLTTLTVWLSNHFSDF